jgi:hypothetical protein
MTAKESALQDIAISELNYLLYERVILEADEETTENDD